MGTPLQPHVIASRLKGGGTLQGLVCPRFSGTETSLPYLLKGLLPGLKHETVLGTD